MIDVDGAECLLPVATVIHVCTAGKPVVRDGLAVSLTARVLRLTLLAPDLVEAIQNGWQGPEVTLARILEPFPAEWREQRRESL